MSLTEVLDEVLDYIHQSPTALGQAAATEEARTAQRGEMEDALTARRERTEKALTAQREEIGEAPTAHQGESVSKTTRIQCSTRFHPWPSAIYHRF